MRNRFIIRSAAPRRLPASTSLEALESLSKPPVLVTPVDLDVGFASLYDWRNNGYPDAVIDVLLGAGSSLQPCWQGCYSTSSCGLSEDVCLPSLMQS